MSRKNVYTNDKVKIEKRKWYYIVPYSCRKRPGFNFGLRIQRLRCYQRPSNYVSNYVEFSNDAVNGFASFNPSECKRYVFRDFNKAHALIVRRAKRMKNDIDRIVARNVAN